MQVPYEPAKPDPSKPHEFRYYIPTKYQMAHWMNTMAEIYNEIHKDDPRWLTPMPTYDLPDEPPT